MLQAGLAMRMLLRRTENQEGSRARGLRSSLMAPIVVVLLGAFAVPASAAAAEPTPDGWSAGPVARWTGYASGDSVRVREVQRTLRRLSYRPGPIDGLFGPRTERSVLRFQRTESLQPDGIVGPRTLRRLRIRGEGRRPPATKSPATTEPRRGARAPHRPETPPTPFPPPRAAPAPAAVPAEPAGDPGPDPSPWLALLALGALAAGSAAWLARGRRSRPAPPRPIALLPAGPSSGTPGPPSNGNGFHAESNGNANGSQAERRPQPGALFATSLDDADALSRARLSATLRDRDRGLLIAAANRAYTQEHPHVVRIEAFGQELLGTRRGRATGRVVPVSAPLFAEGHSDDPSIGDFAGFVDAMAIPAPSADSQAPPRYRVDDVTKAAPVWVREDEISRRMLDPGRPAAPRSPLRRGGTRGRADSAPPVTSLTLVTRRRRHQWLERTD